MKFVKDKTSIKYWILAGVLVLCIYSSQLSKLFEPIFDNVYYGNLVKLFTSLSNAIIWTIEFLVIFFVCKKLKIDLFGRNKCKIADGEDAPSRKKETSGNLCGELMSWKVCALFIATILPMFIISIYLNFQLKLVYSLGIRVTSVGLVCNVAEILSVLLKMLFMILIIRCVQEAMEINFKFNKEILIPWGGIFLFLTVGLIDFFVFPVDLRLFYWLCMLWYGFIYLLADKKFSVSYVLCYLIWLL